MPTIRIDDEVYSLLRADAEPFVDTPNSVLRRRLGLDGDAPKEEVSRDAEQSLSGSEPSRTSPTRGGPVPRMVKLVKGRALKPGESLVFSRPRLGDEFRAVVLDDGRLRLQDGSVHDSPSGAARTLVGHEMNGWTTWRREVDGQTLERLWNVWERGHQA